VECEVINSRINEVTINVYSSVKKLEEARCM